MSRLAHGAIGAALLAGACSRDRPVGADASRTAAPPEVAIAIAAPPESAPAPPLRILVGGDLIPHRPSLVTPASIEAALSPLAPTFAQADVVLANYEAATGDVEADAFRLAHAAPPGWLAGLSRAGIGAVTVANNHACDLGRSGVTATLEAAEAAGVLAVGGDALDPWVPRPIAERGGRRICAIAWTTLMNADTGCARSARLAIAPLDRQGRRRIGEAIARARRSCDATIAVFHGGREYVAQTDAVMAQARHAAEMGADAVIVHHPHVASPVVVHETRDGRQVPLFASVGNLVSNQGESWLPTMFPVLRDNRRLVCVNGWTRLGVLADLSFDFEDERGPRLDWGFHLTWTENEHALDRSIAVPKIEARLLDPSRDAAVVSKLSEDAAGPVELFEDACWRERRTSTAPELCSVPVTRAKARRVAVRRR